MMRERDLAGERHGAAANQSRKGRRVVRRTERPAAHESLVQPPGNRVELRDFERFGVGGSRKPAAARGAKASPAPD